ncbi:coiled-coil domain-containing protein [Bacteroides cellulosilyticus]|jgi:hypothetical protein|uniref:hypothetical protein n=1 Tax=Bacteroides cellulosilyticus TaxID=246787 RepID=UPI0018ACDC97|nr:hypothetical protein [Bacteroides cellulosilyticus]
MKKKLMMVAVLLGVLSLGACVDDNETQSVTDVRNAKAEQLQARADMNNAEAEAQKIQADAEAALITAKADAQKAAAAKVNAEAETIKKRTELVELQKEAAGLENDAAKIENQRKQVELETALANLEVTKKQAEKDLAEVAARMELMAQNNQIELLKLQKRLANAQKALVDYNKQLAAAATQAEKDKLEAEQRKLKRLSNKYFAAVQTLIEAQNTLADNKATLVELESGLISDQAAKEKAIAENNNTIAMFQMRIAKYKEYTNYKTDEEILTLTNKEEELSKQQDLLFDGYLDLALALNNAEVDFKAKDEAQQAVYEDAFYRWIGYREITVKNKEGEDVPYYTYNYPLNQLSNYMPSVSWFGVYGKKYICESGEHKGTAYYGDSLVCKFDKPTEDVRRVELAVNELVSQNDEWKKNSAEELKKYQADYNGKATAYYLLHNESWGSWIERVESTIITRNAVDSTAYLKNAYEKEADAVKKATYKSQYENALAVELKIKEEMGYREANVDDYTNTIAALNAFYDLYAKYDTYEAALQAKITARNDEDVKAYAGKVTAWKAERTAYWAYSDVQTELDAIGAILNGNGLTGAEALASTISDCEGEIARLQKENEDFSFVQTAEGAIKQQNLRIDAQAIVVKAKEIAVADAKADLDALMPAEE